MFFVKCSYGTTCILEIWSGVDASGVLAVSYSATQPPPYEITIPSSQLFIRFTAVDPAVRFSATWVCANGTERIFPYRTYNGLVRTFFCIYVKCKKDERFFSCMGVKKCIFSYFTSMQNWNISMTKERVFRQKLREKNKSMLKNT